MGRAARRKRSTPKATPKPRVSQPSVSHLARLKTLAVTVITAVATYVTVIGFLLPKVAVEPLAEMDPRDPYKQVFKVTNGGNLDLHKLFYECQLRGAWLDGRTAPFTIHEDENEWMKMVPFQNTAKVLSSSETDSLTCQWFELPIPFMLDNKRQIAINIHYRPAYYPFRFQKRFVFSLAKSSSGAFQWLPIAAQRQ